MREKGLTMLKGIGGLKPAQIGVLFAVLVLGIGGAYGVYQFMASSEDNVLGDDQQLYAVTIGDLVNDVSVNGSLTFPNKESLSFGTQGTVGEVLVEEGEEVAEGQPLAVLDRESVATLGKAVAQAEVGLRDAQEALASARSPFTALDVAQAEANVANADVAYQVALDDSEALLEPSDQALAQAESRIAVAKTSLVDAEETLADLLGVTAQETAQAESRVATASVSLAEAEEALAKLLEPTAHEIAQSQARLTDAKLAVQKASDALEALKSGPTEDELAQARSQVDSAIVSLTIAEVDLKITAEEWDQKLEDARDALDTSSEGYRDVFERWLGIDVTDDELAQDPGMLLESWGADLASLLAPGSRFYDLVLWVATQGVPTDDPATRWSEPVVYAWVNFYPAPIAITCEDGAVPLVGACIRKEMDEAWDSQQAAIDFLDSLQVQSVKPIANASGADARAEESLADAEQELADLLEPADPLEIEAKERSLELARTSLQEAEEDLASLLQGPDEVDIEAREQQVALAQANLDEAAQELAELIAGPDPVTVESSQKQLALARVNVDAAEQELAELIAGPDPVTVESSQKQLALTAAKLAQAKEDLQEVRAGADTVLVALREADLAAAEAALESARQGLENATISAPWNAVVSTVSVEAGQQVNRNAPVVDIVDQTVVEVAGVVDEIDVLFVREGAVASVTMDALPGQVLGGVVSEIAAAAQSQQGVVSYPISIRLETPPGLAIPEGLSAVASVVIREDLGVLLVPLDAVYGSFEQPAVRVMNNGVVEERAVSLGNSDDFWIVVEDGIVEGDRVILQSQQASTAGAGFAALRGQFGGFGGGPGGGIGGGGFRRGGGGGQGGGR